LAHDLITRGISVLLLSRLRAWRDGKNLSQSEAALKLQISKRTLQEWEQRSKKNEQFFGFQER